MFRRLLVVLVAALFSLALVACGDDGGIEGEDTTTTAAEEGSGSSSSGSSEEGSGSGSSSEEGGGETVGGSEELPEAQAVDEDEVDSDFEDLATECYDGDMAACDALYTITESGAYEESYGQSCGGRIEDEDDWVNGECAQEFEFVVPDGQEFEDLGSEEDLDELAEECRDGELDSCDELYSESESDSDYEAYAIACGGRLTLSRELIENGLLFETSDLPFAAFGFCEEGYNA